MKNDKKIEFRGEKACDVDNFPHKRKQQKHPS